MCSRHWRGPLQHLLPPKTRWRQKTNWKPRDASSSQPVILALGLRSTNQRARCSEQVGWWKEKWEKITLRNTSLTLWEATGYGTGDVRGCKRGMFNCKRLALQGRFFRVRWSCYRHLGHEIDYWHKVMTLSHCMIITAYFPLTWMVLGALFIWSC